MFNKLRLLAVLLAMAPLPLKAGSIQTEHSFTGGADGGGPTGGLTLAKGELYGTTAVGGTANSGTIFRYDPATNAFTTLYSFTGADDGASPEDPPIFHKAMLYGTTRLGGDGFGTVFALKIASGELTVLHSFSNGPDGANPVGRLALKANILYGATSLGGVHGCEKNAGCGTIFTIDLKSGDFATGFAFPADETDGIYPTSRLLPQQGALLGTTLTGGISGGVVQAGTIFTLDPATQQASPLHTFTSTDGAAPEGDLLFRKGTIYGTTTGGGLGCAGGCGTLYAIDATGAGFTSLHAFTGTDGRDPKGGLIFRKGLLYGTTLGGGTGCTGECGTIFTYNPATGALNTLYNFTGNTDGEQPWGGLIYYKKAFYGTTELGAAGFGTLFKLKP